MHIHDTAPECWRPVPYPPFAEAYAVSCLGNVRRIAPHPGNGWVRGLLKRQSNARGYPCVALSFSGRRGTREIHRMVALAFLTERTELQTDVRHLDGDPSNCAADNLAWGTHRENGQDAIRHGRTTQGVKNHHARFTDDIIRSIRADAQAGDSQSALMRRYGTTSSHISNIVNRKSWRHI
jgi:hypothetical protein